MSNAVSRRSFFRAAGAAGVFTVLPRRLLAGSGETPPGETVCFAAVGVGGQGRSDLKGFGGLGRVVAVADVAPRCIAATMTVLWHDSEFCNEVPRPAVLEEGRELANAMVTLRVP